MSVFNIISLFGGLSLFLYGMRIMGDGLKKESSSTMKKVMEKVTNNPLIGFLLGLLITAIIQSSTATIVLTSGLVGAGLLTLHQSLGIIIGANVGTTVTGQIIRLLDISADATSWLNLFKPSTLAPIAAIVGVLLILAFKSKKSNTLGTILLGFSILFTGLLGMTAAMDPLSESESFRHIFANLADRPLLGFLMGMAVAFLLQSSSATVGILQAIALTGTLSFGSIYSMLIGIYIGDCVTTAIVCSIGSRADQKRVGIVHILFNIGGILLILVVVTVLHHTHALDAIWSTPISSGGIANAHSLFKLSTAVLLLPVSGLFEKLSYKLIRDDKVEETRASREIEAMETVFFSSPAIALDAVHKVISSMAETSVKNVERAISLLKDYDEDLLDELNEDEDFIDSLADHASHYLMNLSPNVVLRENNQELNYCIRCVSEFERIGDLAVNLSENATSLEERNIHFSQEALSELAVINEAMLTIVNSARDTFVHGDPAIAHHIEPLEEVIDDMVMTLRENHLRRLRDGECTVYAGFIFLDALVNIERISDQCSNIGVTTISRFDPKIAEMEHDYIKELHQGADAAFTKEYGELRAYYYDKLSAGGAQFEL